MLEDLNLVVLGSGDLPYESMFRALAQTYPQKVGLRVGYDTGLIAQNRGRRRYVPHAQPL